MAFTRGRNKYNFIISMNNVPLLKIHCTTFWGDHVKYVSAQMSRGVGILRKLRYTLPQRVILSKPNPTSPSLLL